MPPEHWLQSFRRHDLRNIVVHVDAQRCIGTHHNFYRIPGTPRLTSPDCVVQPDAAPTPVVYRIIDNLGTNAQNRFTTTFTALNVNAKFALKVLLANPTPIARLIEPSENTVKHHLKRSFGKFQVKNRAQLLRCLSSTGPNRVRGRRFCNHYEIVSLVLEFERALDHIDHGSAVCDD